MKYWAYVNNEILGPFEKGKLLELPSFSPSLLVCPQTPVGEKTEDWKEASTYPELSALSGQGVQAAPSREAFAPSPVFNETPAPAAEPMKQPIIDGSSIGFKPLHSSQLVEPVPPAEHIGMTEISVNRLGKAGADPAAAQPLQAASSFDPISLSHIERRSETLSGAEMSSPAPEAISLEPQRAFPQPAAANEAPQSNESAGPQFGQPGEQKPPAAISMPAPEPISYAPAAAPAPEMETFYSPAPAAAPQMETFYRPAAAAAPVVTNVAGLESLIQRLDALAKASATRQDINTAVDPLRMKLDQMGEVISSIKNSQFQREVMDKLTYLENSVSELKETFRNAQQAPAPAKLQKIEIEKNSESPFVAPSLKPAEKSNPFTSAVSKAPAAQAAKVEPVEPAKAAEITDTGSKPSKLGPAIKKIAKLMLTLLLLTAVALMGVIGLKNFGIFDATKFIPFPLPFTGSKPAQEQPAADAEQALPGVLGEAAGEAKQAGEKPQPPAAPQTEPPQAVQEQALKKSPAPEATPEIIYITRTFKLKPGGQSLESKIDAHSAKAGGSYAGAKWEVRPDTDGMFQIDAVIPAKTGSLTYSYMVDRAKKTVAPANEEGKATFNELSKDAAQKPAARKAAKQKAAAKPAARQQPKKAPAKKITAPDEEYEYEYVDEDGTEQ